MPKSALIQEGGRPKKVGNLRRIITDSHNGRQPWVPQPLTNQKFISKNGMYLASNDDLDGFSKIRVNVAGGVAGMTKPTVNINGVEVVDPNTDPSVIPNYPAYVPYDGFIGSVIGVDPIDGNTYVSGLDKDGNLKKSKVPSSIRVLIPPAKTTYNVGDKILYYGLVVELLDENGQNCSNDDYPTGTISWSPVPYIVDGYKNYNLITPVETAGKDEYGEPARLFGTYNQYPSKTMLMKYYGAGGYRYTVWGITEGDARIVVIKFPDMYGHAGLFSNYFYTFAKNGGKFDLKIVGRWLSFPDNPSDVNLQPHEPARWRVLDGIQYFYKDGIGTGNGYGDNQWGMAESINFDRMPSSDIPEGMDTVDYAFSCAFGELSNLGKFQEVEVKWKNPYNTTTLSTSFKISVS